MKIKIAKQLTIIISKVNEDFVTVKTNLAINFKVLSEFQQINRFKIVSFTGQLQRIFRVRPSGLPA